MTLGWPSGHAAVHYGHYATEDLQSRGVSMDWGRLGWSDALEDSASASRDLILSRRGLDFIWAG
jgi:hypothetical protein